MILTMLHVYILNNVNCIDQPLAVCLLCISSAAGNSIICYIYKSAGSKPFFQPLVGHFCNNFLDRNGDNVQRKLRKEEIK